MGAFFAPDGRADQRRPRAMAKWRQQRAGKEDREHVLDSGESSQRVKGVLQGGESDSGGRPEKDPIDAEPEDAPAEQPEDAKDLRELLDNRYAEGSSQLPRARAYLPLNEHRQR